MTREGFDRERSFGQALREGLRQLGRLPIAEEMKAGYQAMAEINLDWCRAGMNDDFSCLNRYEMNLPAEEA